jgi:hypothetical protein
MIRLEPTTDSQVFRIIPRYLITASDLVIVLTQEGTKRTETISNARSIVDDSFLNVYCAFTLLSADQMYTIEIKRGSQLLYRDKVYCTSSTSNRHTLNTNKYTHEGTDTGQKYTLI